MRVKIAEFKDKFLFEVCTAFCVSSVQEKTADCRVVCGVVREVEMARHWFGTISVIFYITKMFAEAARKFSPCFSNVDFCA